MPKNPLDKIIICSRQSDLARIQAFSVGELLKKKTSYKTIEYFFRPSMGDLEQDLDLKATQSKGVFTHEFKEILMQKKADLVVHSWKDLPIEESKETVLFSVEPREDQRDLFFLKKASVGQSKIKILTSSPRREYQIKQKLKPLLPFVCDVFEIHSIRGNIPTRFKKFLDSDQDGFVVAKAAVDRLMMTKDSDFSDEFKLIRQQILDVFEKCKWMVLPLSEFPTAAAQGALAIEVLSTSPLIDILKPLQSLSVMKAVEKERLTHKKYGGGCHQVMGFSSSVSEYGHLFSASGTDKGQKFQYTEFVPYKSFKPQFLRHQLFVQSQLLSKREKKAHVFKDLPQQTFHKIINSKKSEFVVTRFEARLEDLKSSDHIVWVSGNQTWYKLAREGYWINGSLDGQGLNQKPKISYLKTDKSYWLSNSSAPEEGVSDFEFLPTYDLNYSLDQDETGEFIRNKECFLWMSGHAFETVLNKYPEIKNKVHFCGLGRTVKTLQKYLREDQIYFCSSEQDFFNQVLITK